MMSPSATTPPSVDSKFDQHYAELRRLAHLRLHRDGGGFAMNTTSLVNECYLKLRNISSLVDAERTHFISYASRAMRSIIVDLVREEMAQRRGGGLTMVTLSTAAENVAGDTGRDGRVDVMAIDAALTQLAATDARLAQVVELRYFGGLSFAEVAQLWSVSERTVRRDWDKAKLLLTLLLREE